jgi:hypothetical protein
MTITLTPRTNPNHGIDPDCRHGLPTSSCSACRYSGRVYTTAGGQRYHWYANCESLRSGQDKVHRRGGVPAPILSVSESRAMAESRVECQTCRKVRLLPSG